MKRILLIGLVGLCFGLGQPSTAGVAESSKACQRFLPISPTEPDRQGVPWHGFFALDTETGQLCRTADWQLEKSYGTLPTCRSVSRGTSPTGR